MENAGRILIVDDIPQNIKVLGALLRKEGYEIEVALSGREALEWVVERPFDLILLDIMMPEMDGYEVCKQLKANSQTASIPVIFLTAKYDSDSVVRGFNVGAVDYLTKPFASEELIMRVRTHLTLRQRTMELERLNASKDKFFSIIAHDLVNPFHALLGLTDVISANYDNYSDTERKEMIKIIQKSAQTGYKLLSELLEWSRQNLQKSALKLRKFVLADAVFEVVESIKYAALKKEQKLTIAIDPGIIILADYEVTKIIIRNLTNNAIKFTPPHGSITIGAYKSTSMVTIQVADTGIGIRPEVANQLFKLDKSFTNKGTEGELGTGLGLVLCHDFVKTHGGDIWVKSEPNMGSTFYFTLPLGDQPE
jgi:two-component system, sensor histidine kinase and response regulator